MSEADALLGLPEAACLLRSSGAALRQEESEDLLRAHGQTLRVGEHFDAKAVALLGAFLQRRFADLGRSPSPAEIAGALALPDEASRDGMAERPSPVDRMIRRFEILYEERVRSSKRLMIRSTPGRALLILRLIGLLEAPAPWDVLRRLMERLAIRGLSDRLDEVTEGQWQDAADALVADGLLSLSCDSGERLFDADPQVRGYFRRRLELSAPEALRAAQGLSADATRPPSSPPQQTDRPSRAPCPRRT